MKKIIIGIALASLAFVGVINGTAGAVQPADLHCPAGGTKVEANGGTQAAINNTVLEAGTLVCVKAGPGNSGIVEADGVLTLRQIAPDGKDVSYYVIYPPGTPPELPISVSLCVAGEIVVVGPGLKADVDAAVAVLIAAGGVLADVCEIETTTTTAPEVTTTTAAPVVEVVPPVVVVVVEQAPPAPAPRPVALPRTS